MKRKLRNEELDRLSPEAFAAAGKAGIVVVLDNVRSLNNVGSIFRTCDAFRVESLLLCGITGTPPNREIEKTALGATSTVSWKHCVSTLEAVSSLKAGGYSVFAVEQAEGAITLDEFRPPEGRCALVFGNEVYGVSQEVVDACDSVIEIPQSGTKHSLNVAVSAGIVLWELLRNPA